jgi:hypothetical protein
MTMEQATPIFVVLCGVASVILAAALGYAHVLHARRNPLEHIQGPPEWRVEGPLLDGRETKSSNPPNTSDARPPRPGGTNPPSRSRP